MYEFLQLGAKLIIIAAIAIIALYTSLRVWRSELDLSKLLSPSRMVDRSVDESLSWLPTRQPDALYQDGQLVAKTGESTLDEENSRILFKEIYQSNPLALGQEFEFQKWRLRLVGA